MPLPPLGLESSPARLDRMRRYLIAVPVLLTIHNVEEVVGGMGATREAFSAHLPSALGSLVGSADAWLVAVVLITVIPWALLCLGGLNRPDSGAARALVVLQAAMTLNVLTHVGGAIAVRGYAGGLGTAVLLYVPFAFRFFPLARRERWVNRQLLAWSPALALLLVPLLFALLALGSALTS